MHLKCTVTFTGEFSLTFSELFRARLFNVSVPTASHAALLTRRLAAKITTTRRPVNGDLRALCFHDKFPFKRPPPPHCAVHVLTSQDQEKGPMTISERGWHFSVATPPLLSAFVSVFFKTGKENARFYLSALPFVMSCHWHRDLFFFFWHFP